MSRISPPKGRQFAVAAALLLLVAAIAGAGAIATTSHVEGWYASVVKVPWDPPNAVFGPVWSALYVLIAIAGFLVWRSGYRPGEPNRARGVLTIYAVQLALNAAWTPMFFAGYPALGEMAWTFAMAIMVALIVSVIALAFFAARWSRTASVIMVVYLMWLVFASSLNLGIIVLN